MSQTDAVGVCGFGRCGSSMVMAMLDAGGLPPAGMVGSASYELPTLDRLDEVELQGRAVKLLEWVMYSPLPDVPWRFVWLDRAPREQAASQVKFGTQIIGLELAPDAAERFAASYAVDRPRALGALRRIGPVTVLQYETVLANPRKAAKRLRAVFPALDVGAAAAVVHARDGRCRPNLAFEIGQT